MIPPREIPKWWLQDHPLDGYCPCPYLRGFDTTDEIGRDLNYPEALILERSWNLDWIFQTHFEYEGFE